MKQLYPLLIVVLCFTACKQDPDFEEIDLGYDYFPTTSGTYIEYDVDSIHYGITVETTSFQLREVITDDFVDEEGQRAYQLEQRVMTGFRPMFGPSSAPITLRKE